MKSRGDVYKRQGCGHFIFLGDCTTPESFRRLIELTEDFPLDAVPGNNDYDVETMRRMAASSPAARLHPEHALITRYGMKLSLSHYPKYALREARSGNADAALYGHTPVSYTHLDVYKRQPLNSSGRSTARETVATVDWMRLSLSCIWMGKRNPFTPTRSMEILRVSASDWVSFSSCMGKKDDGWK